MTSTPAEAFDRARDRLRKAGPATAALVRLGELTVPRRVLGIGRPARIVPTVSAWHLGALLISASGPPQVWTIGDIVRASSEERRGFTAENQRRRSGLAQAAARGGFAEGETVHVGWEPVDLDTVAAGGASGPLLTRQGRVCVLWSAGGLPIPLDRYLDERIALVLDPPTGA